MTQPEPPARPFPALPAPVWAAPPVLLVVAIGPWPYGFYGLLRLVVCASAVYLAYRLLTGGRAAWLGWVFVGLAILYNTVFRIYFERETWSAINLASTAPYSLAGWRSRTGRPA